MSFHRIVTRALGIFALLLSLSAWSQPYEYHVYIDSDQRTTTGCTVSGGGQTFAGAEYRLTATVSGNPPIVTSRTLSACAGGVFGAGNVVGGNYPVGLNNGLAVAGGAADVIELSVTRAQLPGADPLVRIGFGAVSASGSVDVLYTANGLVGGPQMVVGIAAAIPTLGFFAALLLALALSALALRTLKHNRRLAQMLLVGAFFSAGFAAWAANFIADGLVGDWEGVAPKGIDAIGDSVPNLSATDIVGAFAADENRSLFFRIDVVDAENRPPVAVGDAYTTLEDTTLTIAAPGVLANDSDPDGNPITAQLVTGPTRGTLALNANGSFSYTPNANINGSDSFTYNAFDGQVTSLSPATVTISITAVNDVPVFTVGGNQTVLEDAGAQTVNPWATGIDDGDPEVTQGLSFEVTANSNAALFSAAPSISPTGALSYTPAANANGTATITLRLNDDGGTANGGVSQSATQTFTISVNPVNDAPTLTAANPPTVNEDAGLQTVANWAAFNPGPPDEAGQTVLGYQISAISNAALFAVPPAVAGNGTLTYTPAANANGSSTFVARVQDSGGTANGGVDLSVAQTFTITVSAINDVPSFTVGPNQTVNEDAGPQTVSPWATAISDGDPEVTQLLAFTITANTNAALFSAAPSVSPTGVLSYTPAANANGSATITLRLQDDGSNTPPNVNTSATQTFTITVTPVNDAPSFVVGPNQIVNEDAAAQTVNPWATAIIPGPADESGQAVTFAITNNTNAALFAAGGLPAISPTGVLTYTPAANANGVATITLTLSDNGLGAPPPNANTSAPQTFTITVSAVNDAPVNTGPGAQTTGDTVPLVFSTAATNAISVADIDAAAGIVQMSFGTGAAANGSLTLANPGAVLTSLTGNGTEQVIATGTLAALNAALNGPSGSLTYTPVAGSTASRIITVITNDQGNTGSGGAQIDTDTITVNVDAPPVVTSTPANGATIANNAAITVNFSESVNVIAGITLNCGGAIALGGTTGAAVTSLNLTYAAPLPAGDCTLTVPAASVSDVDTIDPPQNPAATYTATFTVDAAPAVTTTSPVNGAITANNIDLIVNFSEPVNFGSSSFTLQCPSGPPFTVGFAVSGTGTATATINPTGDLPSGACELVVLAANITDVDGFDPPQNPIANSTINFTVDKAPAVVSSFPADGATNVPTNLPELRFVYDEDVVLFSSGPIDLFCDGVPLAGGGSLNVVGNTVIRVLSFPLPAGATCEITADATDIRDADAFDPPDAPLGDVIYTFTTDAAPSVTATNPVNGAIDFGLSSNLTVTFNEPVNFAAGAFTLECPSAAPIAFTVSGSGSNTATINPTPATLPTNTSCVFTLDAALVTDVDSADPPDAGTGVTTVNFTTLADIPPTAVANSASVLEDAAATAVPVLANDTDPDGGPISIGSVTQPTNGTAVITGGGTGLTYQPNPNYCNAPPGTTLDTFTYTLSPGGSTATVTMTVTCVDDSPVAVANSATVNEDSAATAIAVLANDTDTDGGPISVGSVTQPVNGTVVITGGGTGLTYQPDANYCNNPPGTTLDTFSYTLAPGGSSATVTMTVTCINDPPILAVNPIAYIAAGNTQLHVAGATRPGVANTVDALSALAKSAPTDVDGPAAPAAVAASGASANGGNFQVFANGSFSYVPPAGFTGTDSFVVQVSDTVDSTPLTVNVTVSQMVWYVRDVVDANNAAGGDGRSSNAVETLPAAALAAGENHTIFVFAGNTAATPLSGPTFFLRNGQKLHGEGIGLTLPTHGTLIPAGMLPRITNPGGGTIGVFTSVGSDRTGVEIRGLSISAGSTAIRALSNGAQNLGLLISDTVIESAGQRAIVIDHPSTGTATLALRDLTITSTQAGLDVNRALGSGLMTITAFDDISVTGNSLDVGIRVVGDPAAPVVFDATPGGAYNQVAGGVSSIGQSGNAIGNAGVLFSNVSGDLAYTDLDVYSATGDAINITGTGVVNVGAGTGLRVTIAAGNGTLSANAGAALVLSSMTADMQLAALTSSTGGNGVSLTNVGSGTTASTISAPAGSAISNATGSDFAISGGNATVNYGGTISDASGSVVTITGATGGTKTFSGAISSRSVILANNTGATINFTGGLALSTGASSAFSATGGGTLNVTGINTLETTTGTALNIVDTTIGGAGMTFRSISSTTASGNAAIVLDNTGTGAFSVTGTGASGTGGTISNKTGDAVQLNNTGGLITLDRMIVEDIGNMAGGLDVRSGHDAIQGLNVNGGLSLTGTTIRRISDQAIHGGTHGSPDSPTVWNGLTLSGVTIENTNRYHVAGSGDANNEGMVRILGIRGAVNILNSTLRLGAQQLEFEVTGGTLNMVATGNFFDRSYKEFTSGVRASIGNHCIDVRVLAGATANVTVGDRTTPALGNEFLNCRIGSVRVVNQPGGGANTVAIIARNNFRVNDHSSGIGGNFDFPMGGVLVWNLSAGTTDTIVESNLFELVTNASGGVGQLTVIAEGGPVQALVQNNTFDRPGNAPWYILSRNSAASVMTARFVGNTVIRGMFPCTIDPACGGGYFGPGLRTLSESGSGATTNLTYQNNTMARHDTGFDPGQTIEIASLPVGGGGTVCANLQNNRSPDGYSLEQFAGSLRTVGTGTCPVGSPSANCQTVLQNNGNQGGAGVGTTVPPFVNVLGTVSVNGTACPVPTGAPF